MTVKNPKTSATTQNAGQNVGQTSGQRRGATAAGADKPMTSQVKQAAEGPVVPHTPVSGPTLGGTAGAPVVPPATDPEPVIDSTLVGQPQGTARAPAERKDQPVTSSPQTEATKSTAPTSPFAAAASNSPKPTPPPAPAPVIEVRRAGFMPLFLGGVIAAALGAGAAYWAIPHLPPAWQPSLPAGEAADPQAQLDAARQMAIEAARAEVQSAREDIIAAATQAADKTATDIAQTTGAEAAQRVLAEAATAPDAAPQGAPAADLAQLATISESLQDQAQRISSLDQAIAALTAAPQSAPPSASAAAPSASTAGDLATTPAPQTMQTVQALQAELARLRDQVQRHDTRLAALPDIDPATLEEVRSLTLNIAAMQEGVQQAASAAEARMIEQTRSDAATVQQETQDIMRRTAVVAIAAGLQAALETGGSLQGGLADLGESGIALPEALAGDIPALPYLQREFDDAARAGLRASLRADSSSEDALGAIGNFLRVQTGARSVQPKEGTDPDAILSRAGAKVRSGDLQSALQELQALPTAGQEAMAAWTADAARWVAARAAISDLSNSVK